MRKVTLGLAAFASSFALAPAAMAQEADETVTAEQSGGADEMAAAMAMMGGLFTAEPLTAEEDARLPAANRLSLAMMPDGFYGKMMSDMMDSTMGPLFDSFAGPKMTIRSRTGADEMAIAALSEESQAELARILDPAYDQRSQVMVDTMGTMFTQLGTAMESPMRDGYARAFAKRFDAAQLADIETFFATPTGGEFASQTMSLFGDPQVMSSVMGSMPAVMSSLGDMEQVMEQAMANLPAEPAYADLSGAQRSRLMAALDIDAAQLEAAMAPKASDDAESDMD